MCDFCLTVKDISTDSERKFNNALEELAKASGVKGKFTHEQTMAEPTPYQSLHDLTELTAEKVQEDLKKLYRSIEKSWIVMEKAGSDVFKLNGKVFINPKTGESLTVDQWKAIRKDLERVLGSIYGDAEEYLVKRSIALGKILQSMDPDDRLTTPYSDVEDEIDRQVKSVTRDVLYDNVMNWGLVHSAELIQDMENRSRKAISNTITQAQTERWSSKKLTTKLFESFSDLNRDWRRISETETATNFNNGYLVSELDTAKKDETIFMKGISGADACPFCSSHVDGQVVVLVDQAPAGGDTVVVDGAEYTAIWPGKGNIGRKRANWWVSAGVQHPHCLIEGTRVMTNTGFKHFKDVLNSDLIMSLNPETEEIEYVKWTDKIQYKYSGEMFEFIGRGYHSIVTPDHRIPYRTQSIFTLRISTAKELMEMRSFAIPRVGNWSGEQCSEHDILLSKFFGWYLSEGSVTKRMKNSYQIKISQYDDDRLLHIFSICNDLNVNPRLGKSAIYISGEFAKWVYGLKLGKSHEKYIPTFIKNLGLVGIIAFLREFNLGDGSRRFTNCFGHSSEEVVYYTSSERLRDDLCELILKTGKSVFTSVHSKKGTITQHRNGSYVQNNDVYVIRESNAKNVGFRPENKSVRRVIDYSGNVYCLTLSSNGIFCYEYNGFIGWTGNCRCTWTKYFPDMEKYDKKIREAMANIRREHAEKNNG